MKKSDLLLIVVLICCIVSVTLMIITLNTDRKSNDSGNNNSDYSYAEFVAPEFDENVVIGKPNVAEDLGYSEIDAQAFKFSICGKPVMDNNDLIIYFTNTGSNAVWLKVRIYDLNNNTLGETGLIKPNEYVEKVSVSDSEITNIKFKIMAYEPETYYSEGSVILNTVIMRE